jgi:hypothetical protein
MSMMHKLQEEIFRKYDSPVVFVRPDLKIDLALDTLDRLPIYGVRLNPDKDAEGWFIWGGDYSDDPAFYQPIHVCHLEDVMPIVVRYLALAPGYRFIIDHEGYEDIWFDASVLFACPTASLPEDVLTPAAPCN